MSADDEKYARYGLGGNPFRNVNHLSVEMVSRVHANLSIDDQLASLKEEVFFKRNNHSVFLVGDNGMGKTHRVMVAHAEALQNNLFSRVITFSRKNRPAMYQFVKSFLPKGSALFSNDKWQRELAKVKKSAKKGSYQPLIVAQHVASALNKNTPSFVLVDDLEEIQVLSDSQVFLQFLFHLSSLLQPGVFLMVTMSASFGAWLVKQYPQVKKLVQLVYLQPLTTDDAEQVIGKWLESNRLVDGLHSLFPFSHDAIELLNSQSHGNVSTLLDLSDMALTAASFQKAVVITDLSVKESLLTVKEKKPAVLEEKQKLASVSPELSSLIQQKPVNDSKRVSESSVNPVPAAGVLAAADTRSDNDNFSSDIIDLTNNEGGSEKEIQGDQVDENMSSFSKESPNEHMKDINLNSPPIPHELGRSTDYQLMDDNTLVDQSQQEDEWTKMKNDDTPLVSQGDNGSKTRSDEPASIMHQAKQDKELKKKEPEKVDDQSEESIEDEEEIEDSTDDGETEQETNIEEEEMNELEEPKPVQTPSLPQQIQNTASIDTDKISKKDNDQSKESLTDTWEPVDEEELIDDHSETDEEQIVEEPISNKDIVSSDEAKQEKVNEELSTESEKSSDEVKTVSSLDDVKEEESTIDQEITDDSIESKAVQKSSFPQPVNESFSKDSDEGSDDDQRESETEKSTETITKETIDSKESSDTTKQSHEIKQHRPQVMHHDERVQSQAATSTRVLRVRCPECGKDFTIELDEHTHSLTCPFCGFQGEL